MTRLSLTIGLIALLVLAGCSGIGGPGDSTPPSETVSTPTNAPGSPTTVPAPEATSTEMEPTATEVETTTTKGLSDEADRIGWENGYAFDDPINVTPEDGFNDTEFAALKARTMARVEKIRGREFEGELTIRFLTRETLNQEELFEFQPEAARDLRWEAAFVVGENETAATELNELYRVVVDGWAGGNRVGIVVENPDRPKIDPTVLSHELGHVLGGPRLRMNGDAGTVDQRLVVRSISEGNAHFVESRYAEHCEAEWSCLERPPNASEVVDFDGVNEGLYLWFASPYTLGPDLMYQEYDEQGLDGVNGVYTNPPATMEQVIHPDRYPDETPVSIELEDRSTEDWTRRWGRSRSGTNTLGETVLYTMFKTNDVIEGPNPRINAAQRTGLNFTHPATDGWADDAFAAYTNESAGAYVLQTAWDTDRDAREFHETYLALLDAMGAIEVREGVYRIPAGPYADAFRVVLDGDRVTIVNAPTVDALDEVHSID